jgi:hypothetical protein
MTIELYDAVERGFNAFDFVAWTLVFLVCIRMALRHTPLHFGGPYREPNRFHSNMSICTLAFNSVLITIQCITVALGLQWLIGLAFYSPVG